MRSKTTYTKLILKIIITTLLISLSIAFVYAQVMKKDAIETLTKDDAKKTTQLVFQSLYSAMEKGWTREDIQHIINRINNIDEAMVVNVYRGEEVSKQFGDIHKDKQIRESVLNVKKAFRNEEIYIVKDKSIEFYYPIVAKQECLKCHTQTTKGSVLGVIDINYPINDLKVSLTSIINFFIIFIIVFSFMIFIFLFFEFDKYLVKPIKKFVSNINAISQSKDITKRVDFENEVAEIESMQEVFNKMLDSLEYQFYNDERTNLPNRKRLIENIIKEENAVLMIINLDKFQEINDLYGEDIGDIILKNTAKLLQDNISQNSSLYKLHADEYALYYKSDLAYEEIKSLASHLSAIISNKAFSINDSEIFINASIGIAFGNSNLLNNADIALKLAKKKGKKYLVYDSSMNIEHEYEQNIKWTKKIKEAIKENRIIPLFQAIVDTKTQKIVKYEALMRMVDENGEYISPIHFLDLAKRNKLYPELTKIVLKKTFDIFKKLNYKVSINLSVQDILSPTVHNLILENLKKYNMGDKVVFEIIESEGIENFKEVISFIKEVKSLGAKISIDDFGTGYSNFEYLMKLNVDYIKIDASMIKDIDKNINSQRVTETITDFARKMNIKTVAEFIHSKNVYEKVKELKIDYCQGYYFGEPKEIK